MLCVLILIVGNSLQAVAGLLSDARQVVDIARDEASNYRTQKGGNIPLKVLPNFKIEICNSFSVRTFLICNYFQ